MTSPPWRPRPSWRSTKRLGGVRGGELTLALADDAAVRDLNHRYRGKDAATNVLSFPAAAGAHGAGAAYLGDIILAEETVLREARDEGRMPLHHVIHLAIHGTLHLLGHDHQTDADAEVMEALETRLLGRLGIADPYA